MKVNIKTMKNFTTTLNKMKEQYGEDFEYLNGLGETNLNLGDFIDNFVDSQTVADASIDGNANVKHKDICSCMSEISKPHNKLLSFNKIFYEVNKKYGLTTARKWLEGEWNGAFYLHDAATASFMPYCYAYDLDKLVEKGLFFVDNTLGNEGAPKHLVTYTDFVGEFVSWTSNRTSGACGLPSFLIYSYYFWKKDCESGDYSNHEKLRDQEFQRINLIVLYFFSVNQRGLVRG